MNQLLKLRQEILSVNHPRKKYIVNQYIGGGGQGEVYKCTGENTQYAVKWYYPHSAVKEQRDTIENLIKKGPPNNHFLWPIDIVESTSAGFGYIMPLREDRFKSIIHLMKRDAEPSFKALCTVGFQLADSFMKLHSMGYSYRDISFGNVFFNPADGDTLICDNDNVAVDGMKQPMIAGTPRFMAPEIVRGESIPSRYTDLYSLSVLLFYILFVHHPLEGKREYDIRCLDIHAMNRLYGFDPLFIFDPNDSSNAPVPGYHENPLLFWRVYPHFIKELFTKAFTEGLHDAIHGRVAESIWRANMIRLRDSIIYCPICGVENFYDREKVLQGYKQQCWNCGATLPAPMRIKLGETVIVLNDDTELFPHHLGEFYDFTRVIGKVVKHPTEEIYGIRNCSPMVWKVRTVEGSEIEVPIGKTAAIREGNIIKFGKVEGELRSS